MKSDLLIIGGGPAGLTAAIYGCRYGLSVTLFESMTAGGQVASTPEIDNYPGVIHTDGYSLSQTMKTQAIECGTTFVNEEVISLDLTQRIIKTPNGEYEGASIILANGAKRRKIGFLGEMEFAGHGVSYCATCDGAFFRGKDVCVIGGGNTALEDALFLSKLVKTVYLIHRRDVFRGMQSLVDKVMKTSNIKICYNAVIKEVVGDKKVTAALIEKTENGVKTLEQLDISGVFVAVGTMPDTDILRGQLPLDSGGYIIAQEDCKTMLPHVFCAGDCRKKPLRQIVTATSDGAIAAFQAASV